MRGRFQLFIFFLFALGSVSVWAGPQAHWRSSSLIEVYFPTYRPAENLTFVLETDGVVEPLILSVVSRHGDLWELAMSSSTRATDWVQRPLWLRVVDRNSSELLKTPVRLTGLLETEFADISRPTGLHWSQSVPEFRLWAPTAQSVDLLLFREAHGEDFETFPLTREDKGFWSTRGLSTWRGQFYLYRVRSFSPLTGRVEDFRVADPQSIALTAESQRSQILDLSDPALASPAFRESRAPRVARATDAVIYEIHLRDYTVNDPGVPTELRGRYEGLAYPGSRNEKHLRSLARAGLTHVHLLPILDFAGVPESLAKRPAVTDIRAPAPDSPLPQEQIGNIRFRDAYNWGYNPVQWISPEGSYASNPDNASRVIELRDLVARLHALGLGVILDVVYNHTYASGLEDFSHLDRIVPYYYYRYDVRGELMKSSCCADIATENTMNEKLILDSLTTLARFYHVDGFRFDLMNLHPKDQIPRIRSALNALTLERDGVDGKSLVLIAEAWPFGSLEDLQPGRAFNQVRSYGLTVGVFNDRLRDALRGGTTDSKEKSDPGFATGLFWDFNREPANQNSPPDSEGQRQKLMVLGDVLKIGLAGNLRDYVIRDHLNHAVRGGDYIFRGAPAGTAADPIETVSYASAHDGYSLFDAVQAKLPFGTPGRSPATATIEDRARTQRLMLATVALSQGIAFFEGGSELLRSKSGDVDSYDSGDWFNHLDWSGDGNNWGVGLPPAWKNQQDWSFWQPRLADPQLSVTREEISATQKYFEALLQLRKSTPLLRLDTQSAVQQCLRFPRDEDSGSDRPGLVFGLLTDPQNWDPERRRLAYFINSATIAQTLRSSELAGRRWSMPRVFDAAIDPRLAEATWDGDAGTVTVPARSVLVLEERR